MCWEDQIDTALTKSKQLTDTFRFLRRYLDEDQFIRVMACQYYSSVYYGMAVWFWNVKFKEKMKFNSAFYRLLRIPFKDFRLEMYYIIVLLRYLNDLFSSHLDTFRLHSSLVKSSSRISLTLSVRILNSYLSINTSLIDFLECSSMCQLPI